MGRRLKRKEIELTNTVLEDLKQTSVLVVGDAMIDQYWFGDVERISPEAPVPIVHVTREEYRLGGAANVALNIKTLGGQVSLMSVIGEDDASIKLQSLLDVHGITSLLKSDSSVTTTLKLRVNGRAQQLLRVDFEERPKSEVLSGLLHDFSRHAETHNAVVFSDYGKGGLRHIQPMIEHARTLNLPTLVDPKGGDYSNYRGATLITPNRAEISQIIGPWTSEAELEDKSQELRLSLELDAVLVTRSEEGISLFDDEGHYHVAANAREVFDVTGAGDTVIAVMASLMGAGLQARDALPVANRAGGLVVGKFGTATVNFEELY
jgi:D-glycero-beta-D-manno-heptose-7-phosphate kinase